MYFKQLPAMVYSIGDVSKLVTNIFTRITINAAFKDNAFLFEEYSIKDNETPESVAFDYYGSTDYHWVIMLCNEIIYPWNDWAVSQDTINQNTKDKYGITQLYTTHHYVDANGFYTTQTVGTYPVSNVQYETDENNKKRSIKILDKSLLHPFITEFNNLIKLA